MKTLTTVIFITGAWVYYFKPEWSAMFEKEPVMPQKRLRSEYLESRRDKVIKIMNFMIREQNQLKTVQAYRIVRMIEDELTALRMPNRIPN
jgi:hypothetical protein